MKKWDKIIILILLVISFLPYLVFKVFMFGAYSKTYAVISVAGEPYKEIPLTGQVKERKYVIETEYGKNVIIVEEQGIHIEEADCADQICKQFGTISVVGESIVCLPHQVYITIKGNIEGQDEIIR